MRQGTKIALALVLCASLLFLYFHIAYNVKRFSSALSNGVWLDVLVLVIFIICVFGEIVSKIKDKHKRTVSEKEGEIRVIKGQCEKEIKKKEQTNEALLDLLKSKTPFKDSASLKADFETCIYEKEEKYLHYKVNPAQTAAQKLKVLKERLYEKEKENRQLLYKYEFLYATFPELKYYVEDDESLVHIANYSSFDDFNEKRDCTRDWLTEEEYRTLSVDERNQRALDRYKMRKKSNWEIGIEYELYIGYLLREGKSPFEGEWNVIQFGEKNGLNDLGRDIIANRIGVDGNKTIYVIQCKRWSEQKVVHENAICQLYGTTVEYKIRHRNQYNIIPVFITTTELSDMAKEFAKQLGVRVMKVPMGDYPMIKCNINGGEKIYHLPFDQQYYRTEITNEGEFYAMTVQEAVNKGFRRAMKHFI